MASGASVARSIRLFADRNLSDAALSANLAARAIAARTDVVSRGDAPPSWITYVDGRRGVPEAAVRPNGRIRYDFNILGLAVAFAMTYVKTRSPVRSGRYRNAWLVVVDGKPFLGELNTVSNSAEIMIVNPEPYARKIDTGGMKMSVPPGIVEGARQAIQRKFPSLVAQRRFVSIPAGLVRGAPYILKGTSRRKDRAAGQQLTYPALIVSHRV